MTDLQIAYWKYKEDQRHNQAAEGENVRHNVVGEVETRRHNTQVENVDLMNARTKEREAATNAYKASLTAQELPSTIEKNKASAQYYSESAGKTNVETRIKEDESKFTKAEKTMGLVNSGVNALGTLGGTVSRIIGAIGTKGASEVLKSATSSEIVTDGAGKVLKQITRTTQQNY